MGSGCLLHNSAQLKFKRQKTSKKLPMILFIIVCLSPQNPVYITDFELIVGYLIFLWRGPCAFSSHTLLFSGILPFCQTCRGSHWRANFLTQRVRGRSVCSNPYDDLLGVEEPLQSTPYTQSHFCSAKRWPFCPLSAGGHASIGGDTWPTAGGQLSFTRSLVMGLVTNRQISLTRTDSRP